MKYLILILFMVACGAEHTPTTNYSSEEEPKELECREDEIELDIVGTPECVGVRNLYDAEEIEIFYTDPIIITNKLSFEDLLATCMNIGLDNNIDIRGIGVLNGFFKDDGYTKDFLLNPDVERTWSDNDPFTDSSLLSTQIDGEFQDPLSSTTSFCIDNTGNRVTCKRFICGARRTPPPEVPTPPETMDITVIISGQSLVYRKIGTHDLYDAEEIAVF